MISVYVKNGRTRTGRDAKKVNGALLLVLVNEKISQFCGCCKRDGDDDDNNDIKGEKSILFHFSALSKLLFYDGKLCGRRNI